MRSCAPQLYIGQARMRARAITHAARSVTWARRFVWRAGSLAESHDAHQQSLRGSATSTSGVEGGKDSHARECSRVRSETFPDGLHEVHPELGWHSIGTGASPR